jgi:hypothetical protein
MLILFLDAGSCRRCLVANISKDHTTSIIRAEVKNVRICTVYNGIGHESINQSQRMRRAEMEP